MIARSLDVVAGAAATLLMAVGPASAAMPDHVRTDGIDPAGSPIALKDVSGEAGVIAAGDGRTILRGAATPDLMEPEPWTADWLAMQDEPEVERSDTLDCLSEAIYFEARGEPVRGQAAVGEVILNRVASAEFPSTVCAVVNQGTGARDACQFSYTCDGKPETVRDVKAYERGRKLSALLLSGAHVDLTGGALYYHTRAVNPYWAALFNRTTTIGAHHFYNSDEWKRS